MALTGPRAILLIITGTHFEPNELRSVIPTHRQTAKWVFKTVMKWFNPVPGQLLLVSRAG